MAKVALLSDLHLHLWPEFATYEKGNSRLRDGVGVLRQMRSHCLDHDISCVAFLGDLLHRRASVPNLVLNPLVRELRAYQRAGIRVLAIPGNHDQADREGRVHYIGALHHAGLVEGVQPLKGWTVWTHQGLTLVGFSFCDSVTKLSRRLDQSSKLVGKREAAIGLFHHGFQGARVGSHLEYQVREPVSARKLLAGRDFALVLSGHYHGRQPIRGVDNGAYVGAPMEFVRGESKLHEKGFLVYDDGELTAYPIRAPKFVSLVQGDLDAGDLSQVKGNFVDVEWEDFSGGEEAIRQQLLEAGARGMKITKLRKQSFAPSEGAVDPRTPPAEALTHYLASRREEIEELGLDQTELERTGREILHKVGEGGEL